MKIYVITAGCYSDYHICGVATTLEMAEKLKEYYTRSQWDSDAGIEIFDADSFEQAINYDERGYKFYQVFRNSDNGGITAFERKTYDGGIAVNQVTHNPHRSSYNPPYYEVYVYAKDEIHARKIGGDLISQYIYKHMDD